MSEKRFPVIRCARCGNDHDQIVFKEFQRPIERGDGTAWHWWGTCPETGDPILLRITDQPSDETVRAYASLDRTEPHG